MTGGETETERFLERTRSAVMNIMVAMGGGIALSGIVLGRQKWGPSLFSPELAQKWAYRALLALFVASHVARRLGTSRAALRDPEGRPGRFFWGHVLAAAFAALAVPLGFFSAWATGPLALRPLIWDILPFWLVGLALAVLAFPRDYELAGLDKPLPDRDGPRP
jgi:hypothetical protein